MVRRVNPEGNQPDQRCYRDKRLSRHRCLIRMNAAQHRLRSKNRARIGQPAVAHTKGSPVIESIPLARSSGIAQLGDTAIPINDRAEQVYC